ncbi:MAG: class I SAM-dependent methyltransferase [Caulobacter sp.]|nr:class I SAM-dependent methyltransferase [Caulobacter sp.]
MAYLRWRRVLELVSIDRPALSPLLLRTGRKTPDAGANLTETWDTVYEEGGYEHLSRSDQRHHHRLLAALIAEARPQARVLEVGCGEGVFYESLRGHRPAAYLGVDVSPLAIDRARRSVTDPVATFSVGDGAAFQPPGEFDAIVFPECLEYLGEPSDVLAHYRRFLAPGGVFGVSMWMNAGSIALLRKLRALETIRDQAVVLSQWGGGWTVVTIEG